MKRLLLAITLALTSFVETVAQNTYQMAGPYEVIARDGAFRSTKAGSERDMQAEINSDIDALVDLKRDIMRTIKEIENPEYQTLLELRYLCFKRWEEISMVMNYNLRHIYRLHYEALDKINVPDIQQ